VPEDNPFYPPDDKPFLPIIITNQIYDKKGIKDVIEKILGNNNMDTLVAVAPFISTYFVNMIAKTPVKNLILIVNKNDLNPDYVNNAIKMLKETSFHVEIRERPPGSRFVHLKILIPFISIERVVKDDGKERVIRKLIPACAISGSVNFTRNGISINDELLSVYRDPYSIAAIMETYNDLLKNTILKYDSRSRDAGVSASQPRHRVNK
jgi:phosphatidylserine/phosphatidylglycerophosphate/cardiolipin synthase-like enzyme